MLVELVILAVVVAAATAMRLVRLSSTSGDLDEGIRGIQLMLMAAGYRPVAEIFSSQGPLLLDMLYPLYRAFGETLGAARLAVSAYSILGIVGIYLAARVVAGPVAGVVAAVLLTFSPSYLRGSRQALAEVPALAPAILAVAAALAYQRSGGILWAAASGGALAIGLLIKPIVLPAAIAVGLALLTANSGRWRGLFAAAVVGLTIVVVVVLATGLHPILDQMVRYRLESVRVADWSLRGNLGIIQTYLGRDQWGLVALAAAGVIVGSAVSTRAMVVVCAWVATSIILLVYYAPLFPKHVVIAVPPLALAGAIGVGLLWRLVGERGAAVLVAAPLVGIGILTYGWFLPDLWQWNARFMNLQASPEGERFGQSADMAASIAAVTAPGDFIVTDHPYLAVLARRLVPPELADPSQTRLRSRQLTGAEIVRAAVAHDAKLVALWGDRFRPYQNVRGWIAERWTPIKVYGRGGDSARVMYLRNDDDFASRREGLRAWSRQQSQAVFGGVMRLRSFGLDREEFPRTGNIAVTYEWEAIAPANVDYHVITELRGPDGQTWSSEELALGGRSIAINDWQPGRWLFQTSIFDLPATAPTGAYTIVVGLYDSKTRTDLAVTAGDPRLGARLDRLTRLELGRVTVR